MANLFGKNKLREIAEAIDTDSVQDLRTSELYNSYCATSLILVLLLVLK